MQVKKGYVPRFSTTLEEKAPSLIISKYTNIFIKRVLIVIPCENLQHVVDLIVIVALVREALGSGQTFPDVLLG